jgi:type I restriction enzyme, S subunit
MIDGLQPYADMKPSGQPWLGHIPAHWGVRRIKTLLREVDNRTTTGSERLLSLRMRQGLVDHIEAGGKPFSAESLVNYKIIEPGQVVMNRMRAAAGLFGVAKVRGLVSPDYAVFEPLPGAYNPYLLQAFRLPSLSAVFRAESKGLGTGESGFLRLYTDRFGPIPVPDPPLDEQMLIVRFLDWHGAQTAKLIRAKKKIIALLNEQKQAIIHRAVTRGLDPNAKLKPSGLPLLGDIPEGWEVKPLKRWLMTKITDGPHETPTLLEAGVPFMSAESMVDGRFDFDRRRGFISEEQHKLYCKKCRPRRDDIFMCKSGATTGKVSIVETDLEFSVWSPLALIRVDPKHVLPHLLFQALQTRYVQQQVQDTWSYGTQPNLSMEAMGNLIIALPPFDQQKSLLEHLSNLMAAPAKAAMCAQEELALIQEFRTRLISDVITGKLDLRAIAASLSEAFRPDSTEDSIDGQCLDEVDDSSENEEVAA